MNEAEVQRRIDEARAKGGRILDLSYCELQEIPLEVLSLNTLTDLNVSHNRLTAITSGLQELSGLQRISVHANPLQSLPRVPFDWFLDWEVFSRCAPDPARVKGITLSATHEAAARIAETSLEKLAIWGEAESGAAASILRRVQVANLTTLQLIGVDASSALDELRRLAHLRVLRFTSNGLYALPDWLSELRELRILELVDEPIEELPESLARSNSLEILLLHGISRPALRRLPAAIAYMPNLRELRVEGHPLEEPPIEVVRKGLEAVREYWRQRQDEGVDYLCEGKLLILGEAGAGKTTLAQKIRDRNYQLRDEKSTEGIEVVRCDFPTHIRVAENGEEKSVAREYRVNVWDFGGQEIYHATHQFFLTRRSVYLLVTDDRKEDTDFNYWLEVIDLLSDNSPVLIVQNEKHERRRDLPMSMFRSRYTNLKDTFPVNLATNEGLDALVRAARSELERLPHIGVPLPATWKRVRERLEGDPRNYISVQEFLTICEGAGFKQDQDKLQLAGYLHDLGIILHFQDDPVLKHTVILKPKWGTDAVYRVLDDKGVIAARGWFSRVDAQRLWAEPEYSFMHHELLRLMMKFQLCYEIAGTDSYIAPQLLRQNPPRTDFGETGYFTFSYQYEFLPKGIVTRLIVALPYLIPNQDRVWRSGAVFERDHTQALVFEEPRKSRIVVRIAGQDVTGMFAIVDNELARIHRSFPRIRFDCHIPCTCATCRNSAEPESYPLSRLKKAHELRKPIQCRASFEDVDASSLLYTLVPRAITSGREQSIAELGPELRGAKEVFVSYAGTDESRSVVDRIQELLEGENLRVLRDRDEIRYKDSIQRFMKRIGHGRAVVVVLSDAYLRSKYCLFELTEIARWSHIRNRVFPVVLPDANIFSGEGRLDYVEHWEIQKRKLEEKMRRVGAENLQGIREELDSFAKYRAMVAEMTDVLADMKYTTDYGDVVRGVQSRFVDE